MSSGDPSEQFTGHTFEKPTTERGRLAGVADIYQALVLMCGGLAACLAVWMIWVGQLTGSYAGGGFSEVDVVYQTRPLGMLLAGLVRLITPAAFAVGRAITAWAEA